jgi:hypothetical protein
MKPNPHTRSDQAQNLTDMSGRANKLPPIDFKQRYRNRRLPAPKLLWELAKALPGLHEAAWIVGSRVWVAFADVPAVEIRLRLSELGFHWNRHQQAWQHPCGLFRSGH